MGEDMFYNNRKTIGVFISQVYYEFQNKLCKGIFERALERDYNVAFFTNFGGYRQQAYDLGEISIAKLPNYEDLDGIILASDTFEVKGLEDYILNQIRSKSKCPVVSVRREIDEFYNVLIDDNKVLEEIITHFIEVHGFTRINFLAGPKGFPDSDKRLNSYRRILKEHNIPVEEERIYHGDFWKFKAYYALESWLESSLEMPQAIVCANDYMAISLCNALEKRGFSVPDDIAVSGCDDIDNCADFYPAITTARVSFNEMAAEAVDIIVRYNNGITQPQNIILNTKTIYRESCGCKLNDIHESNSRRKRQMDMNNELTTAIRQNAFMSADLTGISKLEDMDSKLGYHVFSNVGFKDFYLCLRKNWDDFNDKNNNEIFANEEEIILELAFKNHEACKKIKFQKKDIIPKDFSEDKPMIYYFAVLHHLENCFGYVAISFENVQTYMETFQAWVINVSNALENIRMHGELNRLVYELEDMYVRDDLTGLYNRRGLDTFGKIYLDRCVKENLKLMVLTADMDKLKHINDHYGHAKGDIALRLIASSFQEAADDDEICVRFGGDEFMVIGIDYDEDKTKRFIRRFVDGLNQFNESGNSEFGVYVSYGWCLIQPNVNTTMEECMTRADSRMYQQKYEKASKHLQINIV